MDEAAEKDPRGMAGQLAVMTAVLATVAAMFSYMAGSTQADAALLKNDAAIRKTEASNQWAYYQAKGAKQNLAQLGMELSAPERKSFFQGEVARYESEKGPIKEKADSLERESSEFDARSEEQMHRHHRWAQATTALQVAIAMAAIALLTRKRWLKKVVYAMTGVGLVVGALAYMGI